MGYCKSDLRFCRSVCGGLEHQMSCYMPLWEGFLASLSRLPRRCGGQHLSEQLEDPCAATQSALLLPLPADVSLGSWMLAMQVRHLDDRCICHQQCC